MTMIRRIYLEVTSRCNYRCVYCPHPTMARKKEHLDYQLGLRALKQVAEDRVGENIHLNYLGEPLMYPRFFDLAEAAAELGLRTHTITNGSLLSAARIERLARSPLSSIKISHDGSGPQVTELHGAPAFPPERIAAHIGAALAVLPAVGIEVTVILMTTLPGYWRSIPDVSVIATPEELAAEVRAVHDLAAAAGVAHLASWQEVESRLTDIDWRWWNPAVAVAENVFIEIRPNLNWGNAGLQASIQPAAEGVCDALVDKVAILVDGSVVPCCIDAEGEIVLGNIRSMRLAEILALPRSRALRQGFAAGQVVEPRCQLCLGKPRATQPAERRRERLPMLASNT